MSDNDSDMVGRVVYISLFIDGLMSGLLDANSIMGCRMEKVACNVDALS